jgi:hypothetical protein
MRKRLVWLAAALLCVGLVGVFAGWIVQRGRQIDKLAIEQIKIGMTLDEAVRIVGMPPGDYRTAAEQEERARLNGWWVTHCGDGSAVRIDEHDQIIFMDNPVDLSQCLPERTCRQWRTNLQVLYVIFDDHGIVTGFFFHSVGSHEDTSFERFRRWLSL